MPGGRWDPMFSLEYQALRSRSCVVEEFMMRHEHGVGKGYNTSMDATHGLP